MPIITGCLMVCERARARMFAQAGFPRTREQAQLLHTLDPVSAVIELVVPFDVIIGRLAHRWIHAPSGRIYNLEFNPPKTPVCACTPRAQTKMCRAWMT